MEEIQPKGNLYNRAEAIKLMVGGVIFGKILLACDSEAQIATNPTSTIPESTDTIAPTTTLKATTTTTQAKTTSTSTTIKPIPTTEPPTTEVPTTEAPITEPPTTEAPTTTEPPTTTTHKPRAPGQVPEFVRSGPHVEQLVALTIDDIFGTSGIRNLETLINTAPIGIFTLFPTGGALQGHRLSGLGEIWQRVIDEKGHEVGNHTFSHFNLQTLTDDEIRDELNRTQDEMNQIMGREYPLKLMRPPKGYGGYERGGDPRIMNIVRGLGMSMIMWTTDANGVQTPEQMTDKVLGTLPEGPGPEAAKAGSIILFHFPIYPPENFPGLIDRLHNEKGLEPTTISGFYS